MITATNTAASAAISGPKSQGQQVIAEFQAINKAIAQGKTEFTLRTNGLTKRYEVEGDPGDKSKSRNVYKDVTVKEETCGKSGSEATTRYQIGSADGIDNMLFVTKTPENGAATQLTMTYPQGMVIQGGGNFSD